MFGRAIDNVSIRQPDAERIPRDPSAALLDGIGMALQGDQSGLDVAARRLVDRQLPTRCLPREQQR